MVISRQNWLEKDFKTLYTMQYFVFLMIEAVIPIVPVGYEVILPIRLCSRSTFLICIALACRHVYKAILRSFSVRSFLIAATTRYSGFFLLSFVTRFACDMVNWQRFGFEFHLRSSPSALSGYN